MPRKKREVPVELVDATDGQIYQDAGNKEVADAILDKLATVVDIPDDKPAGISLRDRAVLHLVATAELHRFPNDIDMQMHRIKRCIEIANLVVKLLGEDNGEV